MEKDVKSATEQEGEERGLLVIEEYFRARGMIPYADVCRNLHTAFLEVRRENEALREELNEYAKGEDSMVDEINAIRRESEKDALDAKRWRWIRQLLSIDGDNVDEDGTAVQWIRVDEEKLLDAAQPGWTHTVESIVDAALGV